ncbi:DUF4129 domain-containing protein [Saccharothrix longispora]|uniref:Protein-glutamine gamma-glutamyltransferase-like C-terminal domain-containing protein n=1 Tax=Saccharothrix longispora TaxID=33920 RepID=A0ABU1Q5D8_9PSEU|nr:DUF4129 domain-containing protein [Saccharothrix longispora]MDR6598095.1 hypothetical protein [Saccharothrix longispora]
MKPRLAIVLLTGAALVLVALAARGSSPVRYADLPGGAGDTPPPPAPTTDELDTGTAGSVVGGSFAALLIVLVAVTLIVVVGLLLSLGLHRRRRRAGRGGVVDAPVLDPGHAEASAILLRRATEALADLRDNRGGPPGDAVVAAWLALERAAEDSGVPRKGHQTPTEFTGELLTRHRVDEDAAGTLRRVYQRARFGTAEVTEEDARTAASALERVVRDLG